MAGKTLILEGLPADFDDKIKLKLSSYFQIKRRSGGGEISALHADPTDKRRAVLVYVDEKGRNCKLRVLTFGLNWIVCNYVGYSFPSSERSFVEKVSSS